jgi:cytochrome P450
MTEEGGYSEAAPGQPRGAYLPFGAGSHVCVGAAFAWTEAILVLATLARRWRPTRTFDQLPTRATVTLRPARPVAMRLGKA